MTKLTALIDAIADDLESLPLPAHNLWRYLDPPVVPPTICPLLGVYARQTDEVISTTEENYEVNDTVCVAWFASAMTQFETGLTGDDTAKDAMESVEMIVERLRTYGDSIPGLDAYAEADVTSVSYGLVDGNTWMAEAKVRVHQWA